MVGLCFRSIFAGHKWIIIKEYMDDNRRRRDILEWKAELGQGQ